VASNASSPVLSEFVNQHAPLLFRRDINPRDHSLLETIYKEMHLSGFINLSPLALLANLLEVYFKG
jgi:hypothetical protein